MPIEKQILCDGCGDVLHGQVKGHLKHHDYFSLKNVEAATLQLMDPRTQYREYIFLNDHPGDWLNFCLKSGMPCLSIWIDRKRAAYNFRKKQKLRKQAEEEHLSRLEAG